MLSLFLTEAAVGSLLVLLLIPPRAAGRKFFQFTVGQSALLIALGEALAVRGGGADVTTALFASSSVVLLIAAGLFHLGRLDAAYRTMVGGLLPALAAAALDVLAFVPAQDVSALSRALYVLDGLTCGLLLGSVLIGMILGHTYLNVPGLSIGHLQRVSVLFMAAVAARLAVASVSLARGGSALGPTLALLFHDGHSPLPDNAGDPFLLVFVLVHVLAGMVVPAVLAIMVWRTAAIASTQSATGILYVALVLVIMGELASRYLLTIRPL